MSRSQVAIQPFAFALNRAKDGAPAGEVCRKMGISEHIAYEWKKHRGEPRPSESPHLKQPKEESAQLSALCEATSSNAYRYFRKFCYGPFEGADIIR
jgi:hypothetical protein